jgi:thioredoxin reductase (NADPH)
MKNVIILGSGMAGLSAAIYAGREGLDPVVVSGFEPGGQITLTTEVENYPGFPEGILGPELAANMRKQAERFGATFMDGAITALSKEGDHYSVMVGVEHIQTKAVIIATGASARMLGLPAEQKYIGRGVHTCATCDGFFYKGKEIAVIGGGDSACEEATFLSKFASKVTIIHRRDALRASKIMQEKVKANPKIGFLWNTGIEDIKGDGKKASHLVIKDLVSGKVSELKIDGMFLAIGHVPNTGFLKGIVDLDEKGYIKTDRHLHTNLPGVFAAGDVQDFRYRQAATAAGTGVMAALEVRRYLEEQG